MRIAVAARYLFTLGLRVDRRRLLRAVVLMFAGYIAAPLAALALRSLTDSLLGRHAGPALTFALLAALLLVAQLMLSHFAHLDYFEVAELQRPQSVVRLPAAVRRRAGAARTRGAEHRGIGAGADGRTAPAQQAPH
jgi:hypothetical protein